VAFSSITTQAKNHFASLGWSYTEQKNHFVSFMENFSVLITTPLDEIQKMY